MASTKIPPPPRPSVPRPHPVRLHSPPPPPKALSVVAGLELRDSSDRILSNDDNILAKIECNKQEKAFWSYLHNHKADIEAVVSFHLRLETCQVGDIGSWKSGSFNVCIPVFINPPSDALVLVRIPLPYKVGEAKYPGNVDEKLRCEVASYMWIQENCPDVPIPKLFGCGFPDGQTFTSPERAPLLTKVFWYMKRTVLSWLQFPTPCRYVSRQHSSALKTGYIIISYVTNGAMLSNSWKTLRHDKSRRSNLFHSLARIILSLNQFPLPRIGSLTVNNQGIISLTNRPLTLRLQALENEGIPTGIDRNCTYSATDLYLLDLLRCHDNRIRYQPNSIHNKADGRQQLAALTIMRATYHQFTDHQYRYGPFFLWLTDCHQSNIFVDSQWNITCIIDLEWTCVMPIELQCPPYWLSDRSVDDIGHGEPLESFTQIASEFFDAFEQEERGRVGNTNCQPTLMRNSLVIGSFWYFQALHSPKGLFQIFKQHIQPIFCAEHCSRRHFDEYWAPYWSNNAADVIKGKIKEERLYRARLKEELGGNVSYTKSTQVH